MMKPPAPDFDDRAPWGCYAPTAWQRGLMVASHSVPAPLSRLVVAFRRPIKYGVHHPLDVTVWGLKLRLLPRGNTSEVKLLFAPQLFDREEFALLADHLRPGGVFVDVGANAGAYTLWARRCVGEGGRVLAVEPDPEMRRRLEFNLRSNGIGNVEVCPVALSDRDGEGELLINPRQRGQNTLADDEAARAGGPRVAQRVKLMPLSDLLAQRGVVQVDALKIDIEGHEPPVLTHFFTHAPRSLWPALAITEYKPSTAALIEDLFTSRGYRRVLANRGNLAFRLEATR